MPVARKGCGGTIEKTPVYGLSAAMPCGCDAGTAPRMNAL
jgi:hypothetical protein